MLKEASKTAADESMKIIAVMSRKGGAGKTTLVRALMSAVASSGRTCLALDADPQGALSEWAERTKLSKGAVEVRRLYKPSDLQAEIDFAWNGGKTDYVLVDTQGAGGEWADYVAVRADHIVCPVMLSDTDFKMTMDTFVWYQRLRERATNPEALPTFVCVVSRVPRRAPKTMQAVAAQCVKSLPVVPTMFMERAQHADSDAGGLLHELAAARQNDPSPLMRQHARNYEETVQEAVDILQAIERSR